MLQKKIDSMFLDSGQEQFQSNTTAPQKALQSIKLKLNLNPKTSHDSPSTPKKKKEKKKVSTDKC